MESSFTDRHEGTEVSTNFAETFIKSESVAEESSNESLNEGTVIGSDLPKPIVKSQSVCRASSKKDRNEQKEVTTNFLEVGINESVVTESLNASFNRGTAVSTNFPEIAIKSEFVYEESSSNSSNETTKDGTNFPECVVKSESVAEYSSNETLNKETEVSLCSENTGLKKSGSWANSVFNFRKTDFLTDLVVKIKQDEDKSDLTRNLVGCHPYGEFKGQKSVEGENLSVPVINSEHAFSESSNANSNKGVNVTASLLETVPKSESGFKEPSNQSYNKKREMNSCIGNTGIKKFMSRTNTASKIGTIGFSIDLVVKIKQDEDKSDLTRNLVEYHPNEEFKDQKPMQGENLSGSVIKIEHAFSESSNANSNKETDIIASLLKTLPKVESHLKEPSNKDLNKKTEMNSCVENTGIKKFMFRANTASKIGKTTFSTDLVVKIKQDQDKSDVTRNLVGYHPNGEFKDQKPVEGENLSLPDTNSEPAFSESLNANSNKGTEFTTNFPETVPKSEFVSNESFNQSLSKETEVGISIPNSVVKSESLCGESSKENINEGAEVCANFLETVVKSESAFNESSNEHLNERTESNSCSENAGMKVFESSANAVSKIETTDFLTDLVGKIKQEDQDKSKIMHDLVGYLCDEDSEDQKSMEGVKFENNRKSLKETRCFDNPKTYSMSDVSLLQTVNEATRKPLNGSQTQSKINYDSESVKLLNVSVKLEDLFSNDLRKLGKAHTNTRSCLCIYCCGEYRYNSDSRHFPKNLQNEKSLTQSQSFSGKSRNRVKCQQESDVGMQKAQRGTGSFLCQTCSVKCKNGYALSIHLRVHSSEKCWQCVLCPKTFTNKSSLYHHYRCHSDVRPFKCEHCSAKFASPFHLKGHSRVHTKERPFKCNQCSAKFTQNSNLSRHLRVHNNERPFQCAKCPENFKFKSCLIIHLRSHSHVKRFECELCRAKFSGKQNLKIHSRLHTGERPFKCKLCPAKYTSNAGLKFHLSVHSDERPFKCAQCPANFKLKANLYTHLKLHSSEKPFDCNHCPAKFKTRNYLKLHLRVHTGEKPCKCKLCPAKFAYSSALSDHLKQIHSDARWYECKHCPSKFKTSSALSTHQRRKHSNETPLSCAHCSAKFKVKPNLINHLKECH